MVTFGQPHSLYERSRFLLKVILYDNKKLNLPSFKTFNERVKYIDENIINHSKYKKYYNICATDLTQKEIECIGNWWIGVKKVNTPYPVENIKKTLNYLTSYILGSRDFSVKSCINRYLELKKKSKNEGLTGKDLQDFESLQGKIVYEHRDFVFFNNLDMENQLKIMLLFLEKKSDKNFTDNFMIEDIQRRLETCKKIKSHVEDIKNSIIELSEEKFKIKSLIKKEFELFQVTKDENVLNSIILLASKLKQIQDDINYYNTLIKEEHYQNYLLCTEFFYKTK